MVKLLATSLNPFITKQYKAKESSKKENEGVKYHFKIPQYFCKRKQEQ